MSERLNIVIPMAGRGSRFRDVGYTVPKPLIPVHGRPMCEIVIANLRPKRPHRFVFLCLAEHLKDYRLEEQLQKWSPGAVVVPVGEVTQGAACTVLLARAQIDNEAPLMIANCDQWVDLNIDRYLDFQDQAGAEGLIMTMTAADPKWSYLGFDAQGRVNRVVEKQVISDVATVGIYNFKRGRSFVEAADAMIAANERVNGEFYVAPTYNQMIAGGALIVHMSVGEIDNGMYGLGLPDDLNRFLAMPISQRASAIS